MDRPAPVDRPAAVDPPDDRRVGRWDLTEWRTRTGHLLVAVAARLSALVGPHLALVVTLLVSGLLVVAMTGASAALYEEVVEGDGVAGLDRPVLDAAIAVRSSGLDRAVTAYTDLGGPVGMPILTVLATAAMALTWRRWSPVLLMLAATAGSLTMTGVGKAVVGRARPPLVDAVPPYESSPSLPSGHTLNAVVVAGVIAYLLVRRQRRAWARAATITAAATFATTMGLSRVYLGHHWLTDVLIGWTLGLAWLSLVIVCHRLFLTVHRHRRATLAATA